jgi:spore coat protein CotH
MRALLLSISIFIANASGADFPGPRVWPIKIEITAEDAAKLRAAPREHVRANMNIAGKSAQDVAIRLKGHGSFLALDEKPNLTIEFDKFVRGQRPHGLQKIHLNNSIEDPTYLKEQIGSELFRAAGIPTPRVTHAQVRLNGRMLGLYVLKEGFTEDFLARNFQRADGNLYDTGAGHDIDQSMELDLGVRSAEGQPDLKRLASVATDSDLARRWKNFESILDVGWFINFMAMEMLLCHWDGYCLSQNNYRVYFEPGREKIVFLPAGMDQIFPKADLNWQPDMLALVARSVMETAEGRKQYRNRFESLLDSVFAIRYLTNRVMELTSELRPFVTESEFKSIRAEAEHLREKISQRGINLRKQLREAVPQVPDFINGIAIISGWQPFDEPAGGKMIEDANSLRIAAGPKTSASWRARVQLKPGRYIFSAAARTVGADPLLFGSRQGACLRVIGNDTQSRSLLGTRAANRLACEFEIADEQEVVLACELRASGGEAIFEKLFTLAVQSTK